MEYFEKLKLQAEQFSEMTKKRSTRIKFLYEVGFSYQEVKELGYAQKIKY